jgi:glutamate N-acetyltransferase/amino-acid N-acetyltransferase
MSDLNYPLGYKYAVVDAGFRKPARNDLALALSERPAMGAAMFTRNRFCAAPVLVGRELVRQRRIFSGVLINSGQANACTGAEGERACRESVRLVEEAAGVEEGGLLPASTGVIGTPLRLELWRGAAPLLVGRLGQSGPEDFARAIMTTDRFPKIATARVRLGKGTARLCGMAKGAGMICPDMATMLAVLLCDADVAPELWRRLLRETTDLTFNRVTVDGDTSTNDTVYALTNGAGGARVDEAGAGPLRAAMLEVLGQLAYMLVEDGEGATKVLHIRVSGARDAAEAEKAARTIGASTLVKTAMYGQDANWGRIIAALGRSGAVFDPQEVVLRLGGVELFKNGLPLLAEDTPELTAAVRAKDIDMELSLGCGEGAFTLLASDLTHKYVDINAAYRS